MCVPGRFIVKGLYWHKNARKIHKGRWPASRTRLFTFSGAAGNAESLFSKQPVVVRSTALADPRKDETGHLLCPLGPRLLGLISIPRAAQETREVLKGMGFLTGPGAHSPASLLGPGSLPGVAVLG